MIEEVYCKYKLGFAGSLPEYTTNSKLTIDIEISTYLKAWIINNSQTQILSSGSQQIVFDNLNTLNEVWIVYKVRAFKDGSISFTTVAEATVLS